MFVLILLLVGLSFVPQDKFPAVEEAKYFPSSIANYHSIANPRFNFWIDIPESWRAIDSFANGDGYYIQCGTPRIDIRVYGGYSVTADTESIKLLAGKSGKVSRFAFKDGTEGFRISVGNKLYFVRFGQGKQITLYVSANTKWLKREARTIEAVARSLRHGIVK